MKKDDRNKTVSTNCSVMKKTLSTFALFFLILPSLLAQENDRSTYDEWLSSCFDAFHMVDAELRYCMAPIIEERLIGELSNDESLNYPYDSLAKRISIHTSDDKKLKTFSWDRLEGGSWHEMASYAQYQTSEGVKCMPLNSGKEDSDGEPTSVVIYENHTIKVDKENYYLLIGWGTYGSGKHHSLARVYQVENDTLVQQESFFDQDKYLYTEANRGSSITLTYQPEQQIITYFSYEFDEEIGFYKNDPSLETWKLVDGNFKKQN